METYLYLQLVKLCGLLKFKSSEDTLAYFQQTSLSLHTSPLEQEINKGRTWSIDVHKKNIQKQ